MSVLDPAVDVGELRIALGDVDDRGQGRRPPGGAQQVADVRQDGDDVTFESSGVGDLLLVADLGAGIDYECLTGGPVTVDGLVSQRCATRPCSPS